MALKEQRTPGPGHSTPRGYFLVFFWWLQMCQAFVSNTGLNFPGPFFLLLLLLFLSSVESQSSCYLDGDLEFLRSSLGIIMVLHFRRLITQGSLYSLTPKKKKKITFHIKSVSDLRVLVFLRVSSYSCLIHSVFCIKTQGARKGQHCVCVFVSCWYKGCLFPTKSFHWLSRDYGKGRVSCPIPPPDISEGPGSGLQSGGDNARQTRQNPLRSPSLFTPQQTRAESHCGVWMCRGEAGGAQHR